MLLRKYKKKSKKGRKSEACSINQNKNFIKQTQAKYKKTETYTDASYSTISWKFSIREKRLNFVYNNNDLSWKRCVCNGDYISSLMDKKK